MAIIPLPSDGTHKKIKRNNVQMATEIALNKAK